LFIIKRVPPFKNILPVYAVTATMLYGWTIRWLLWGTTSWLHYLTIGEIATIFSYSFSVVFLESLVVILAPISLAMLLPPSWFRNVFVARGSTLVILSLSYVMFFASRLGKETQYDAWMLTWAPLALIIILLIVYLIGKVQVFVQLLEFVSDRLVVLLYPLLPLSGLSIFIVLWRNLF
jgi:hypothetical protein